MCTAGVHAAMITTQYGGTFTIQILAAQSSYRGSKRNGVTTSSYGPWQCSYRFVPTVRR